MLEIEHGQCRQDRQVTDAVQGEGPGRAPGRQDDAADGGTDNAGCVEHRRVQRDRALDVLARHQIADERLPSGCLEGGEQSEQERQHINLPQLHVAAEGDRGHRQRLQRLQRTGDHDQSLLANPVGNHARDQRQGQRRCELEDGQNTERRRRVGHVEDQPGLRNAL